MSRSRRFLRVLTSFSVSNSDRYVVTPRSTRWRQHSLRVRSDTLLSQGAGDVIADVIERIGGGPALLDLGAGGIQFRPLQCGLPYLVLCYGECGRRKSCKCMRALKRTVEQDAGVDSVVD